MPNEITLTAETVDVVFRNCLFKEDEDTATAVLVDGIVSKFGFHPERLAGHRETIFSLLTQLPDEFMQSKGGGWSFLNACIDKKGALWGEQPTMEQLFALGLAAELVTLLMPKEMWSALPGGMPYFAVQDKEEKVDDLTTQATKS